MSLLNEARADLAAEAEAEKLAEDFNSDYETDNYIDVNGAPQGIALNFEWLKAETGPGSIESYLDHPLNAASSRGIAQILRGFTGLCGSLNLAVLDIVLGALETVKEKRASNASTSDI